MEGMTDNAAAVPESSDVPEGAVVVGLDDSERDPDVLAWGAAEASRRGLPLHIVNARESLSHMVLPGDPTLAPSLSTVRDTDVLDELDGSDEVVGTATDRVREMYPGVEISTSRPWGTAVQTLLDVAESADCIVVGGRRRSAVARLLLGSTALSVAAHAPCPVIVIGPDSLPETERGRVVVGVDGSSDSKEALEYAFEAARSRGVPMHSVTVWNVEVVDGFVVTTPGSPEWQQVERRYRDAVEELVRPLRESRPEVEVHVDIVHGPRVATLVEASRTADLLVVGSRGRGGFAGLLLGSMTQGVLQEAACPVAVLTRTPRRD